VADLALDPDAKGNNQSRVLQNALNYKEVDDLLYHVPTVLWDDHAGKCIDAEVVVYLPHDMMAAAWKADSRSMQTGCQDPSCWDVPAFTAHPVTKANGVESTTPLTIYADATPFTANEKDSFYAIYVQVVCLYTSSIMPGSRELQFFGCRARTDHQSIATTR
jgi:hypothetical protein